MHYSAATFRSTHVPLPNSSNDAPSRSAFTMQCRTVVSDYRKNDFNERLIESNQFRDLHFPGLQQKFHEVSSLKESFELALNKVEVVKIREKMLGAYKSLKASHEESKERDLLKEIRKDLFKVIPKKLERVEEMAEQWSKNDDSEVAAKIITRMKQASTSVEHRSISAQLSEQKAELANEKLKAILEGTWTPLSDQQEPSPMPGERGEQEVVSLQQQHKRQRTF